MEHRLHLKEHTQNLQDPGQSAVSKISGLDTSADLKNLLEEQKAAGASPQEHRHQLQPLGKLIDHMNSDAGKCHCRLFLQAFYLWDLDPPTCLSAPVLRHLSPRNLPGRDTAPSTSKTTALKASEPTVTPGPLYSLIIGILKFMKLKKNMVTPNNIYQCSPKFSSHIEYSVHVSFILMLWGP